MARRSNQDAASAAVGNDGPITSTDGNVESIGIGAPGDGGLLTVNIAELTAEPGSDADSNGGSGGNDSDGKRSYTGAKRGRKPGQKSKPAQSGATVSVSGLEKTLLGIHSTLAALTKIKTFEIDKAEAHALAEASANVARHYNASLDPKWLDIMALAGVLATVYGPRMAALVFKKKPANAGQHIAPENSPSLNSEAQDMAFISNLPSITGVPLAH